MPVLIKITDKLPLLIVMLAVPCKAPSAFDPFAIYKAALAALYLIRTLNKAVDVAQRLADEALIMQKRTATLFAELQHRVANNLTFLTAVLNLHGRKFGNDDPIAGVLDDVKERLMSMSRSHRSREASGCGRRPRSPDPPWSTRRSPSGT